MVEEDFQKRKRALISGSSQPVLKSIAVMRRDALRGQWVVLSPERIMTLDEVARAILRLCDGERSVDEIVKNLAKSFHAPEETIKDDVIAFLQELSDQLMIDH